MTDKVFGVKEDVEYYTREGAYLIAVENNKVAVAETPRGYFLLGGGIDNDESHIDCVRRECMEEAGVTVEIDRYFCSAETYQNHPQLGYFHPIQYYYLGRIIDKVTVPIENDHVFKWVNTNELTDKFPIKQQEWAIKEYLKGDML